MTGTPAADVPGAGTEWALPTRVVHTGTEADPATGAIAPPIVVSSIYGHDHPGGYSYGRDHNPTWERLERVLADLEQGADAVLFGSGMAAASAVLSTVAPGGAVVAPADAYNGTRRLLSELERAGRLSLRWVQSADSDAVAAACAGAELVWLETLTNPLLRVPDIAAAAAAARRAGARSVVDNTFATPVVCRPLGWGADLVLHSASKYIGGHSDLVLGAVVSATREPAAQLRAHRSDHGAIPGQLETWLALRGVRTLGLRVPQQMATAAWLAARLAGDPRIATVHHPALPSHPDHLRARHQLQGGLGAVISVELRGSVDQAEAVCRGTRLWANATSLGGVESTLERRARWPGDAALPSTLLRLSVGIEDRQDLLHDLDRALAGAGLGRG